MWVVWAVILLLYATHTIGTPTVIFFVLGALMGDSWQARNKGDN